MALRTDSDSADVIALKGIAGEVGALILAIGVLVPLSTVGHESLMKLGTSLACLLLAISLTYFWCLSRRDENRVWLLGFIALSVVSTELLLLWLTLPRYSRPGYVFPALHWTGVTPLLLGSSLLAWSRPSCDPLRPFRSPKSKLWASSLYILAGWTICLVVLLSHLSSIPEVKRSLMGTERIVWVFFAIVAVPCLTLLFVSFPDARVWRIMERPIPRVAYALLLAPTLALVVWLVTRREFAELPPLAIGLSIMLLGILIGVPNKVCWVIAFSGNALLFAASAMLALLGSYHEFRVVFLHVALGSGIVSYMLWPKQSDILARENARPHK